ncbi:MAG: phospho-sugar mutase, partial [Ilumatobacteraceae bacterium]
MSDFRSEARRWLAAEPDADMRAELESLLAGSDDELSVRFEGRLQFGTAGLRAAVGAGPQRMNRLVVQQAAAGLVDYLLKSEPDAATRGVIIGYDARRKSDSFALDTARACAARGVRAMIFPHVVPTPMLAWNIVGVGAAAGVVVTASHNPPADNGYKVFTSKGAQIVSPVDAEIAARIDTIDPCAVLLSEPDDPLIEWLDDSYVRAYVDSIPSVRLWPELEGVPVAYSALHGVGGGTLVAAFDRAGLP